MFPAQSVTDFERGTNLSIVYTNEAIIECETTCTTAKCVDQLAKGNKH